MNDDVHRPCSRRGRARGKTRATRLVPDDGGSDLTGVSWRSGFDSTSSYYLKPLFFRPKLEDFHLRDKKFFVRQGWPSE